MIREALFARLTNFGGLTGLVGNRVFPAPLPQSPTLPAITYQRISGVPTLAHTRVGRHTTSRYQFTVWADDSDEAALVAEQVRLALDGWVDKDGPRIGKALLVLMIDDYEPETQRHRVLMDFMIGHDETIS